MLQYYVEVAVSIFWEHFVMKIACYLWYIAILDFLNGSSRSGQKRRLLQSHYYPLCGW